MAMRNLSIISGSHQGMSLYDHSFPWWCYGLQLPHFVGWICNSCWAVGGSFLFQPLPQLVVAGAGSEGTVVVLSSMWYIDGIAPFFSKAALRSGVPVCWKHVGCLTLRLANRPRFFRFYCLQPSLTGLEGSVLGDWSVRQIWMKDIIVSSILLLFLPSRLPFLKMSILLMVHPFLLQKYTHLPCHVPPTSRYLLLSLVSNA